MVFLVGKRQPVVAVLACSSSTLKFINSPSLKFLFYNFILIHIRKLTNCSFLFVLLHLCLLLSVSLCLFHISHLGLALTHVPSIPHQTIVPLHLPQSSVGGVRRMTTNFQASSHLKTPCMSTESPPWTPRAKGSHTQGTKMQLLATNSKLAKGPPCSPSPCSSLSHSLLFQMMMGTCLFPTCLKPTSSPRACSIISPFAPPPSCPVSSSSFSFCSPPPSQCHMPSLSPSLWLCASATWSPRRPP